MSSSIRRRSYLTGRKVLLAEDDYEQAREIARLIQRAGARVMGPFSNSVSALRVIANHHPSCAVLSIELRDGARFGLAAALYDKGIPIIFLTGLDPRLIPAEFAQTPVLRKPVVERDLLNAMSEVLESARSA